MFLFRLAEEVGKTSGAWRPNKMQNQKTSQHRNMSFQIIPPRCLVQPQYRNKIVLLRIHIIENFVLTESGECYETGHHQHRMQIELDFRIFRPCKTALVVDDPE